MKTEILMMHTSQSIIKLCSTVEYLVVKCTFEFFIDFQVNSWFFLVCSRSTTQKIKSSLYSPYYAQACNE